MSDTSNKSLVAFVAWMGDTSVRKWTGACGTLPSLPLPMGTIYTCIVGWLVGRSYDAHRAVGVNRHEKARDSAR